MAHSGTLDMVTLRVLTFEEGWGKAVRLKTASAHCNDLLLQKMGHSILSLQFFHLLLFSVGLFLLPTLYCSGTPLPPADSTHQPSRKLSREEDNTALRTDSKEETSVSLQKTYYN